MAKEDTVKGPEEIIEHLLNNIEGLHGLEVDLLKMIQDYGFSEYKKGWNRCIDVGYEDVVHKYDE